MTLIFLCESLYKIRFMFNIPSVQIIRNSYVQNASTIIRHDVYPILMYIHHTFILLSVLLMNRITLCLRLQILRFSQDDKGVCWLYFSMFRILCFRILTVLVILNVVKNLITCALSFFMLAFTDPCFS